MTTLNLIPVGESRSWLTLQGRLTANETAKGLRLMWRRRAMVGSEAKE